MPQTTRRKRKSDESDLDNALEEEDLINVDFDFFNFVEDDYLSIKNLLRQLLSVDSNAFNLSKLTQQVLNEGVGSTVKADDEEYNDVMAMIAAVPVTSASETGKLLEYWIERTSTQNAATNRELRRAQAKRSCVILSERVLNMPIEVVPPLYQLLSQELDLSNYDYLIIPSRMYTEEVCEMDRSGEPSSKKGALTDQQEFYPFHHEDSTLSSLGPATVFAFKTPIGDVDSRRAFQDHGIRPFGHIAVLEASKLSILAERLSADFGLAQ